MLYVFDKTYASNFVQLKRKQQTNFFIEFYECTCIERESYAYIPSTITNSTCTITLGPPNYQTSSILTSFKDLFWIPLIAKN